MMERPLMTADELKSMPKGQFVVMKTGFYPMKVKLKLFFEWGISFDEKHPYEIPDQGNRKVEYAEKKTIMDGIIRKYRPDLLEPPAPQDDTAVGGQDQPMSEKNQPQCRPQTKEKRKSGGTSLRTAPKPRRQDIPASAEQKTEVTNDGQT